MAKSKSGGTRAMIRGRVGNDVYSIGLNGAGKKQQVVRSLAEVVANPQTTAQMKGRMIMSTLMQAVSVLRPIIDHSFDGIAAGQPSISEFIKRNYKLIKDDVAAHPASSNNFGLVPYQQKGMQPGKYVISEGEAQFPTGWELNTPRNSAMIPVGATPTYGTLKTGWNLAEGEYYTTYAIDWIDLNDKSKGVKLLMARLSLKSGLTDSTSLTDQNAAAAFNIEGNTIPTFEVSDGQLSIKIDIDSDSSFYGLRYGIITRIQDGKKIHSSSYLVSAGDANSASDQVLPTYPTGSQMFLNGGEI